MICNGIVKDDKTIELNVSMSLEIGQRVSLVILPYDEERQDLSKTTTHQPHLSSDEIDELERIVGQGKPRITKRVQGSSPVDVARVMRALPSVPSEDVGALERAMTEDKNMQGEARNP